MDVLKLARSVLCFRGSLGRVQFSGGVAFVFVRVWVGLAALAKVDKSIFYVVRGSLRLGGGL